MFRFIGFRLLQAIPVILVVITVTFFLVRIAPGGPFSGEKAVLPEVKVTVPDLSAGIDIANDRILGNAPVGGELTVADPTADVYALGILLYQALTGEQPSSLEGGEVASPSALGRRVAAWITSAVRKWMTASPSVWALATWKT